MRQTTISLSILLCLVFSTTLMAQQQWWFDVEVIIFKRDQSGLALAERFEPPSPIDTSNSFDLIGNFLKPDVSWLVNALPYCFESEPQNSNFGLKEALTYKKTQEQAEIAEFEALFGFAPAAASEFNSNQKAVDAQLAKLQPWFDSVVLTEPPLAWEFPSNFPCVYHAEHAWFENPFEPSLQLKTQLTSVPIKLNAPERPFNGKNRLLAPAELKLNQLAHSISRQSDLTLMSHIGWRQQVEFGENRATPLHLFAGQNFTPRYNVNGQLRPTDIDQAEAIEQIEISLVEQVERILNGETPALINDKLKTESPLTNEKTDHPVSLWELDGLFKVYLRLLGQTPYLHIDSQLVFRQEDLITQEGQTNTQLSSYQFDQLRRIISQQIHYFDHPLFGMVVQLRRYHPPQSD